MLDGLLRGERGQDSEITGARQRRHELPYRVQAGRLYDQNQHMLYTYECLGLDGDAMAGGGGSRYVREQRLSPPGQSRAVFGAMPVLSDEQSDESLLWHPSRPPR